MLCFCFFQCGVGGGPRVGGRGVSLCVCVCVSVSVTVSAWFKVYGWLFFSWGRWVRGLGLASFRMYGVRAVAALEGLSSLSRNIRVPRLPVIILGLECGIRGLRHRSYAVEEQSLILSVRATCRQKYTEPQIPTSRKRNQHPKA